MPHSTLAGTLLAVALAAWVTPLVALSWEGGADDEPDYLAEAIRPGWRLEPYATVFEEIRADIDRPLVFSGGVVDRIDDEAKVVLILDERIALREALELLETSQGLHFTAEPLRLLVETAAERRDRRRRMVNLHLRDFAATHRPPDLPGREMGFTDGSRAGGGGFDIFAGEMGIDEGSVSAEDILNQLERISEGGEVALSGTGNLFLFVTPEEEAAMRELLARRFAERVHMHRWHFHRGLIADGAAVPTGLVEAGEVVALIDRLEQRQSLTLAGLDGQTVSAGGGDSHRYLADAEVAAAGRLDPRLEDLALGGRIQIATHRGRISDHVAAELAWVELRETASVPFTRASTVRPGELSVSAETEVDEDGSDTETDARLLAAEASPGEGFVIELPTLWSWQPMIDAMIPHDRSLVLSAPHPSGARAVMIIEKETP